MLWQDTDAPSAILSVVKIYIRIWIVIVNNRNAFYVFLLHTHKQCSVHGEML